MKDSVARILLALASADTSRSDLNEFLRWLEQAGLERAIEAVHSLREIARVSENDLGRGLFVPDVSVETQKGSEKQLVSRVEKLFLESKLTKADIVKATVELLKQRGYAPKTIPDAQKIAFRIWIQKLLRRVQPDELLNIASLIRNHAVHVQGIDWPLRRERL
ncbi:hypothetical protein IVB41_05770 [Bradyrhizobium sp. 44]|uniref:hypothetical protein n=1 Tax=Bradyrhizobium sp. 44 TaxID=2782675 RepID=UPI001FF7C478|nr:hypothetical protein [Bradyrhizobium sp. 44]MCK1283442.1 hypothetical protein [Bradyrhizobium sp. 44]